MATFTITDTKNLNELTGKTGGDIYNVNGGKLIINTDTRWGLNAPAAMVGTFDDIIISATLGGEIEIDATAVRWLAITGGSSTCSIGTTITQGGVSGYFLGYWASLTATPSTTIGATGFIKFRSVTGGTFSAGALSGITATASGADVAGWIEVVGDQATGTNITVPRLGTFRTRGTWFELGTTTGSANQLVQLPTNGSTTTYSQGLWIETGVGTDSYEFYPAVYVAGIITTNFGTDIRSKFVCMETNGSLRIGHNGTTAVCYVPASGCKIRVPNIFLRQALPASRATNVLPSATMTTRPEFVTTSAGVIDIEYIMSDWYHNYAQASSITQRHSAIFDQLNISECASAFTIEDTHIGVSASLDMKALQLTSNFSGGTVSDCKFERFSSGASDHSLEVIYCKGQTLTNVQSGILTFARNSGVAFQISQSSNITLNNCRAINQNVTITTSKNVTVNDLDYVERYMGTTNTTAIYASVINSSSDNILIDGLTLGFNGTIANVHPYAGFFNVGQSSNIRIRNVGSRTTALSGGTVNNPAYIYVSSGNNDTVKLQRIYMTPTRTGAISTANSDNNVIYEHVYGDMTDTMTLASLNSVVKNCGGTNTVSGQASVYGTHFWDAFTSDTAGRVILSLNEPTSETTSLVTYVSGNPRFTSAGNVSMPVVGDEVIIESSYYVKGCTALTNTAPIVTGTNVTYSSGARWGNHDIYYQIDTGSGYGGTWKNLTAANLITETISPSTGFKLKYRLVCATANTGNLITYIRIATTSTLVAQRDNLYVLDTVNLTLTGLQSGSEVRAYTGTDPATATEIGGVENSGTSFTFSHSNSGETGYIIIHALGYIPISLPITYSSIDASIPIQQTTDRWYSNP